MSNSVHPTARYYISYIQTWGENHEMVRVLAATGENKARWFSETFQEEESRAQSHMDWIKIFGVEQMEKTLKRPLDCKEIQPVHPKVNQSWMFIGRTNVEGETPILGPPDARADSFEKTLMLGRLRAGGEGDDRGWDGWMASPAQWTWVWVNSGSWRWTGRPGMLQSMGSQTWLGDWTEEIFNCVSSSTKTKWN